MSAPKKVNYLNNKDILKEIHKSKMTFCFVEKDQYNQFDIILDDISEINKKTLKQAKENQAARIQAECYAKAMSTNVRILKITDEPNSSSTVHCGPSLR